MKPDTVVQLGDFAFQGMEVPEVIPFGGEQLMAIHKIIGGAKVVDVLGAEELPLEWSGRFQGEGALDRARQLDRMRKAGRPLKLAWSELSFTVVIRSFSAEFERSYQLPYKICCEVVEDTAAPITSLTDPDVDEMIGSDMARTSILGGLIGNAGLSGAISTLQTATSAVSRFATATQAQISSVLDPLRAVQTEVTGLIGSVGNTLENIATVGGVAPFNPIAQMTASLTGQAASFASIFSLYELDATTARMSKNLEAIGISGASMVMAGGDLYQIATDAYDDLSGWATIAAANGMTDPEFEGVMEIVVPPTMQPNGGVLGAP